MPFLKLGIIIFGFYRFSLQSRSLESWFPGRNAATEFTGTLVSTERTRSPEHPPKLLGAPESSGIQNLISIDPNRFSPGHPHPTRACSRVRISACCCVWENPTTNTRTIDRARVRWTIVFSRQTNNKNKKYRLPFPPWSSSFHVTRRGFANVEWARSTCYYPPVPKREVYTLEVPPNSVTHSCLTGTL